MAGLATVVSRIREDIDRGTAFDNRIKRALDDAIHYYREMRFGFNTKRKAFLVSAEYTTLTANWIEVDSLVLQRSSYTNPLCEKPYLWIVNQARSPTYTAEPTHFAIQNRQLRLYPAPNQSYSVEMIYLYDLGGILTNNAGVSLSASDSFSNAWLTEGERMIRMHAQGDVLINYVEGPEAIAKGKDCMMQAEMIERTLKRRANREGGAGMLEPWL